MNHATAKKPQDWGYFFVLLAFKSTKSHGKDNDILKSFPGGAEYMVYWSVSIPSTSSRVESTSKKWFHYENKIVRIS